MSTKIYEAYKVVDLSMDELMDYLLRMRTDYINECVEFVRRTKGDDDFSTVSDTIREDMRTQERAVYNFVASIMVYFLEGEKYIQFFGMDFTEGEAYRDLVENHLIDYHYQNQADPWYAFDENMTEEEKRLAEIEYEEREVVWNKIYGRRWRPNECGLVFELCTKDDYYKIAGKVFNLDGFGD